MGNAGYGSPELDSDQGMMNSNELFSKKVEAQNLMDIVPIQNAPTILW